MNLMENPRFKLTEAQTEEMRTLWSPFKEKVEPSKNTLVAIKLARKQAVFSRRQLYMIAATLVSLGAAELPDWLHEMVEHEREYE